MKLKRPAWLTRWRRPFGPSLADTVETRREDPLFRVPKRGKVDTSRIRILAGTLDRGMRPPLDV